MQQEAYELIHFAGQVSTDQLLVDIDKEGNGFPGEPYDRELLFEIKRVNNAPDVVLLNNEEITITDNIFDYYNTDRAAYFDQETHVLMVHFLWTGDPVQLEISGTGVGVAEQAEKPQRSFVLHAPYPNPFSNEVHMKLDVAHPGNYRFTVHDIYGNLISYKNLFIANKGRAVLGWNGRNESGNILPSGTYIFTVKNQSGETARQKAVLIRR